MQETAVGDSFERLILDMRHDEPDVVPEGRDNVCALLNALAERLEALVAGLPVDPLGSAMESKAVHPEFDEDETTPIYNSVLRSVTGDGSGSEVSDAAEVPADEAR